MCNLSGVLACHSLSRISRSCACLTDPLNDPSFLWMLAGSFEGSLALVDACRNNFSRISCTCGFLPEEAFKDLSFLQCSWLFTQESSHLHARRTFQGSLSRSCGVLTRSSQGYRTCRDHGYMQRFSECICMQSLIIPCTPQEMTSLTASGKDPSRKEKEEGEILQLGSQRGGDLQPEKKNMTEGRKYDKTSSIKSEQPAC
jgi:hypothetical protein